MEAWYRAQVALKRAEPDKARVRAENLAEAALAEDLRELSANPMLLTTMALIPPAGRWSCRGSG